MIPEFGKFGVKGERREVDRIPSDYLRWVLEQPWVEEKHGVELIEEIESVMAERDAQGTHWHEYEEEADDFRL